MHLRTVRTLTLLSAVALIACGQARKSESASAETARCTRCHGGIDNQTGAPPGSLRGEGKDGTTSAMGVGAHSAHVQDGTLARAFDCTACHPDPRAGSTHLDGSVELALDGFEHEPVASAPPEFVRASGTCASVYCHGAFRGGNGANAPVWTQVGAGQAACGSCHGAPPAAPHPASTDCGRCHSGYAAGRVNLSTHVNGKIDLDGLACTSCHGDPDRAKNQAAPPLGSGGETATTERAVGAHQAHLDGASLGKTVECSDCHEVPTSLAHANGAAELKFGPLATGGGKLPASFDGASCTTYCHGATLASAGGSNRAPRWTGGAAEATCGTCHGVPPPAPHPTVTGLGQCAACHPQTVNASGALIPASAGGKHLDGTLQSSGHGAGWMDTSSPAFHAFSANSDLASCTACHGAELDGGTVQVACARCHNLIPDPVSDWRRNCVMCHGKGDNRTGAPPRTTWGNGGDAVRVGAHTTHVTGSAIAPAFACGECHVEPDSALSPGHVDGSTATVTFGTLATAGTAVPVWDRASATCASTYCHGGTLAGGTNTRPKWTNVGTGEASCGNCHGVPPPAPHPANTSCSSCHAGYTQTSVNVATHVNGKTDLVNLTCASCHGDPARPSNPAAPPVGTRGETSTTQRAVGAHQAHLTGTSLAAPVACTQCHNVPTSLAHANGAVELTFGALATKTGKVSATFNGTTCSNYCHGASLGGGSVPAPLWTGGSSQAVCGACHGLPPPSPHPAVSSNLAGCATCHNATVTTSGSLIPAATGGKHLNGAVDGGCVGCHSLPANANYWHSGSHGGTSASTNGCQVCHEDATGLTSPGGVVTDVTLSTATNCGPLRNQPCAASHNDGVVTLTPQWSNLCFNCHGE